MATRIKTIEFSTQTIITTLGAATNRDLAGSTSIFIPETGITFKSVVLYVDCTNDAGAVVSLTLPTISITLGAAAISTLTLQNPLANSAEQEVWSFSRDVTSYFTTNWTGTNMTWSTRVNFTGLATANHSSKVIITYQFDDSASTQIKTIRIPIESTRTSLTTSWQTVGGATAIPDITGAYLPETEKTIRQIYLELWGNAGTNNTTNYTWQTRINGGTAIDTWRSNSALNSAVWAHSIINITSENLTAARSLECIVNGVTSRIMTCGGMIVVTYEFNPVTSTTIYNSLLLGAVDTSGWIGGTTSAEQGVWERNIYIEEPDIITLKESSLCLFQNDSSNYTFNIRVSGDTSSQTAYSAYVMTSGNIQCGTYSLVHRIDAGGQNGAAGISLKRGKNLYRVQFYSGTAQAGWNLSGFMILNYTSGKHPEGISKHTHSVYQHVSDNLNSGSRTSTSLTIQPSIPETNYSLIGFLYWLSYNIAATTDINFTVDAEVVSTDTLQGGDGWTSLYNGTSRSDNENMNGWIFAAARTNFKRWEGDPEPDRLNIKTSRRYRISSGGLFTGSMGYWYTYNDINYTVSGTCSGYSGNGSGIGVDIYRVVSNTQDEMILNLTTTAGGIFNGKWIDNTDTLYATARQDDTHVGRSANGFAT
jgi:hypothetical protein